MNFLANTGRPKTQDLLSPRAKIYKKMARCPQLDGSTVAPINLDVADLECKQKIDTNPLEIKFYTTGKF